jgi:hypothetical protein
MPIKFLKEKIYNQRNSVFLCWLSVALGVLFCPHGVHAVPSKTCVCVSTCLWHTIAEFSGGVYVYGGKGLVFSVFTYLKMSLIPLTVDCNLASN